MISSRMRVFLLRRIRRIRVVYCRVAQIWFLDLVRPPWLIRPGPQCLRELQLVGGSPHVDDRCGLNLQMALCHVRCIVTGRYVPCLRIPSVFVCGRRARKRTESVQINTATSEKPSKLWFERCFLGLWLLMCTLLSYTFLGSMKANLIVLTPTLRIDGLDQLVEHPELTLFYGAKTPGENIMSVGLPIFFSQLLLLCGKYG